MHFRLLADAFLTRLLEVALEEHALPAIAVDRFIRHDALEFLQLRPVHNDGSPRQEQGHQKDEDGQSGGGDVHNPRFQAQVQHREVGLCGRVFTLCPLRLGLDPTGLGGGGAAQQRGGIGG